VVYRNTARSVKSVQNFDNFFFIFLNFFGNFDETKHGKAKVVKQSVVERGSQLQDEPVQTGEYVELWVSTQYDSED
jgi:hypothetical protein